MKRALIVIDVQNEYIDGSLRVTYPPLEVSVPNILAAMKAATDAHVAIVVVQHVAPESSPIFAEGSHGGALLASVAGHPRSLLVDKTEDSAFDGTVLGAWLAAEEVDTITIAGYMTQNCDEATARDAVQRGFSVELLSDATGTLDFANEAGSISAQALHESVLIVLQSGFAAVTTTAEWVDALQTGAALSPSDIFASTAEARTVHTRAAAEQEGR